MSEKNPKIAKTATDALKLLWKNKYFLQAKGVKATEEHLSQLGYNFTDKNLMMAFKNSKFLTRRGVRGEYMYIQKHPYSED